MRNCFESLLVKWPIVTRADLFWPISFHVNSTFGHKSLKWAWVAFQKKWGMLNAADRPYSRPGDHKDRLLSIRSVVVDSSRPNCRQIFRVVSSSVSPSSIAKVGKEFSARDVREEKIEEARVLPAVWEADQERVLDCLRKEGFLSS